MTGVGTSPGKSREDAPESDYEARGYYEDLEVAEHYDQQFRTVRRLGDVRAQVLGHFEDRAFRRLLALVPPSGTVLDVACGTGRYVRRLLGAGYGVIGTDVSSAMLSVARRSTSSPRLLDFVQSDAASLPFATGEFDGVTCMRLYHRVPREARLQMLREVRRVSRSWAILFFGLTNSWLRVRRAIRSVGKRRPTNPNPVTMEQLHGELDSVGLRARARHWVLPGLAEGLVVLVGR